MSQEHKGIVLAVDDDPASLRMLFDHLQQFGFKVLIAEKGASAMKRIERFRPDIVLLDVNLPDTDGFELCRRVKEQYPEADIPVMFLTMHDDIGHKLKGLDLGAVDYITKPFEPEEVVARVERHLALRNLQLRLEERNEQLEHEIVERKRAEDKLRESEAKLRAVFAAMPDLIFIMDRHGRYLDVAPTSSENLYKPADEVLGNTLQDILPRDQADALMNAVYECLETGETVNLEYPLTIGEEERWFEGYFSPMSKDTVVYMARDITERKQAEKQRLELAMEREKMNILSHFVTQASHEFKTPLSIINTSAYIVGKGATSEKEMHHVVQIENQVKNIETLVDSFVAMVKLDRQEDDSEREKIDFHQIVHHLQAQMQPVFQEARLTCVLELCQQPLQVHCNVDYILLALRHVVENAVAHTPQDGAIVIRSEMGDGYAIVHIIDAGDGIRDDALPYIFKRFYRADDTGHTRGFGLGLPIAEAIVKQHNGRIEVVGKGGAGEGAIFSIWLPLVS